MQAIRAHGSINGGVACDVEACFAPVRVKGVKTQIMPALVSAHLPPACPVQLAAAVAAPDLRGDEQVEVLQIQRGFFFSSSTALHHL